MERALDSLYSIKQFLMSIVGNTPFGILAIDLNGIVSIANQKSLELLGLEKKLNQYIDEEILNLIGNIPQLYEILSRCIDKTREEFDLKGIAVYEKTLTIRGRVILNGMLLTFEDLTEEVRAFRNLEIQTKQLQSINKELEQFAYISSHDLQEPLKTMIGLRALLEQKLENSEDIELKSALKFMGDSATRMSGQIGSLLEYSRLGRKSEKHLINLNSVFAEVLEDLKQSIHNEKAVIKQDDLPEIFGYRDEIRSLLQNLVTNAIKYRNIGASPEIAVQVKEEDDCWKISVKDNGIGIEEKNFDKIFVIFQRLHEREDYNGSGIGLAHCKKIAQLHGGRIWVESELGKGSSFIFEIAKSP